MTNLPHINKTLANLSIDSLFKTTLNTFAIPL